MVYSLTRDSISVLLCSSSKHILISVRVFHLNICGGFIFGSFINELIRLDWLRITWMEGVGREFIRIFLLIIAHELAFFQGFLGLPLSCQWEKFVSSGMPWARSFRLVTERRKLVIFYYILRVHIWIQVAIRIVWHIS